MSPVFRFLAAAGLLGSTAAVAITAQRPLELPADQQTQIVVYGQPEDRQELGSFVQMISAETREDQLARWRGRICPDVIGMRDELNAYVRQTIYSVGELVDAPIAERDCRHNVIVVMTDQPAAFLEDLRSGRRDLFGSLTAREREGLAASTDAVQIWSRIEVRGERGDLVQGGEVSYNVSRSGSENLPYPSIRGAQASRISRASRSEIEFRAIIIDLNRLDGQNLQQLSAFAAMLALGEFDVSQPIVPARTILNLFHDAAASPDDITDWDIAYLRALYATSGGRDAQTQRSTMVRHMRQQLLESTGE